jgi:divalent metal cation (Fe/Co/Zn/Cd) transporter
MDAVPEEIDSQAMRKYLSQRSGVTKVHDLHIWAVSTTETALTAHLVKPEREETDRSHHDPAGTRRRLRIVRPIGAGAGVTADAAPRSSERLHRRARRIEWFLIAYNLLEAGIALAAGIIVGSAALTSFGFDSAIEIAAAAILLWRLYSAGPDASGGERARAENRALYFIAGTFLLLAAYIVWEAWGSLAQQKGADTSLIGLIVAACSVFVMPIAGWLKFQTGRAMGSEALQADAMETFVCAWLSLALLAGVGLNIAFGWWWSDTAAALAMLPVVAWQGWHTFAEARETEEAGGGSTKGERW